MRKTIIDDTHTFEEFGFRQSFGTQLKKIGEISLKRTTIPGMMGSWSFGEEIGDKRILFTLYLEETSDQKKERMLDQLVNFLCDDEGYPRTVKISLRREPDRHFFCRLDEVGEPEVSVHTMTVQLYFTLTDPRRYSNAKADDVRWGSKKVDFQAQYKLGNRGSGAVERLITGNTTIYPDLEGKSVFPIIMITGSGSDVVIKCKNSSIIVGSFTNKTIRIDTEMFVTYVNGVETIPDMDKFQLHPKASVVISGRNMNFKMTLDYYNVYS